jgi:hypothetical protein
MVTVNLSHRALANDHQRVDVAFTRRNKHYQAFLIYFFQDFPMKKARFKFSLSAIHQGSSELIADERKREI